jgi:predicted alpha-1,6-mannanase (GH76 family)
MKHVLCCGIVVASSISAFGFWPADADTIFNSYNNAFYIGGANAYYKNDTTGGRSGFWSQAEEIEMVLDSYARTGSTGTRDMVTALCNGFLAQNGSSWTWNTFNDDIAWAVIAFSRAYQITGNTTFRDRAKSNWDAMYARAYDTALGGGLWWTTDKGSKNACINGPGAIGAYLLYQIYGDSIYLTKAQSIYNWERATLFNSSTGAVADSITSGGVVNWSWIFTYNTGTFLGIANYLGQTGDATLAANYTKNNLCTGGILPDSGENGDGGGFNGIFLRWMCKFMKDRNLQNSYLAWLQQNANAAWNVRRTADNLSWCNWRTMTPTGTRYSFGCGNSVIALQDIPADGEGIQFFADINYEGVPSQLIGTGNYTLSQLQARGVSDNWVTSLRVPSGWQVTAYSGDNFTGTAWTFTSDTSWIGSAANDQMTSCKIQATGVIFYKDSNYGGARGQTLAKGTYTMAQLGAKGIPNDWASSLRVPPGWTVTIYQNDNLTGTSWNFTSDTSYVGSAANDQMTSVRIQ